MNVAPGILAAILANEYLTARLGNFGEESSVHTRRPVPEGAEFPLIAISPDITVSNEDGVKDRRPVITRDVVVYGEQPKHYRVVEEIGYRLRDLFHRNRNSITVEDWDVVDVQVTGPVPAPTDDEKLVGRRVSLRIRLVAPVLVG